MEGLLPYEPSCPSVGWMVGWAGWHCQGTCFYIILIYQKYTQLDVILSPRFTSKRERERERERDALYTIFSRPWHHDFLFCTMNLKEYYAYMKIKQLNKK